MAPKAITSSLETSDKRVNKEIFEVKNMINNTAKDFEKFHHQLKALRELIASQSSSFEIECSKAVERKLDSLQHDINDKFERVENALSLQQLAQAPLSTIAASSASPAEISTMIPRSSNNIQSPETSVRDIPAIAFLQDALIPEREQWLDAEDQQAIKASIKKGDAVARRLLAYVNMLENDLKRLATSTLPTWYSKMKDAESKAMRAYASMNYSAGSEKRSKERAEASQAVEALLREEIAELKKLEAKSAAETCALRQFRRDADNKAEESEVRWNDQLTGLIREIQGHKHDKSCLDNEIRDLRVLNGKSEFKNGDLRKQIEILEGQLQQFREQQASTNTPASSGSTNEYCNELNETAKKSRADLEEQKKANKALQIRSNLLSSTEQANKDLKKKVDDRDRKLRALDEKVKQLKDDQAATEAAKKEILDKLHSLEKTNRDTENYSAALMRNQKAGEEQIRKLDARQQELAALNSELVQKESDAMSKLAPLQQKITVLMAELASSNIAKDSTYSSDFTYEGLVSTQRCHDASRKECNTLHKENDNLTTLKNSLANQHTAAGNRIDQLQGWVKVLESEKQTLQDTLTKAQAGRVEAWNKYDLLLNKVRGLKDEKTLQQLGFQVPKPPTQEPSPEPAPKGFRFDRQALSFNVTRNWFGWGYSAPTGSGSVGGEGGNLFSNGQQQRPQSVPGSVENDGNRPAQPFVFGDPKNQ